MSKKQKAQKATRTLHIRIPDEIYESFEEKCISMDMSVDKIIENMIKEWLF